MLFLDARHIYRQMDRAHREWTPAQIGYLANIVRLYRGEDSSSLGGDEAEAKLQEVFGETPDLRRRAGPLQGRHDRGDRGAGLVAQPRPLRGRRAGEEVSDEDFKEQLETLNEELETLNAQARELEETIARNVAEILEA